MNLTPFLLFLHIATMFTAVTVGYGSGMVVELAHRTGQVAALRGVGMTVGRLEKVIPVLYITGGLLGLLTAISFGFNLLAPWLIIAYVLFLIAMVIGMVELGPRGKRLGMAIRNVPDGPIPAEISAILDNPRANAINVIDYAVVILLVFDMVVKPFS